MKLKKKGTASPHSYLGLCIASWGFGAEIIYSLNLGFWSSMSFFSPTGFTGSGGFSLLWGPFVHPWREKECLLGPELELSLWCLPHRGESQCVRTDQVIQTWPLRLVITAVNKNEHLRQCWGNLRSQWFFFCSRTIPGKYQRIHLFGQIARHRIPNYKVPLCFQFYLQCVVKYGDSRVVGADIC